MKVKELIEKLKDYNQDAEAVGVFNYTGYHLISLGASGGDGCTKKNCDEVTFHFTNDKGETSNEEETSETYEEITERIDKRNKWIKCSDRLPKEEFDDGYTFVFVAMKIDEDTWRVDTDYIRNGKWEIHPDSYIVFWMPIPPIPTD